MSPTIGGIWQQHSPGVQEAGLERLTGMVQVMKKPRRAGVQRFMDS